MKRIGTTLGLFLLSVPGAVQAAPLHPETARHLERLGLPLPPPEPRMTSPEGLTEASGTHGRRAGTRLRVLVLLADFEDLPAAAARDAAYFEKLLFSVGELPGGSLREYYRAASYGRLDVSGEVHGWFRMPLTRAEYAGDHAGLCPSCFPKNARGIAAAALTAALETGVDVLQFDDNGPDGLPASGDDDGILDGLLIVASGRGTEKTGQVTDLRSHFGTMTTLTEVSGIQIPDYVLFPERENVGVAVHEFGHLLGGEDLYDESSRGAGLGLYSVMAFGLWLENGQRPSGPDPFTRIQWGFVSPETPRADQDLVIPPVSEEPFVLRLWTRGANGAEYFLVENRPAEGLDAFLPGEGLLVYHVDETQGAQFNPSRYRVSLVEADGGRNLSGEGINLGEAGDYLPGPHRVRYLDDLTTPSLGAHDGKASGVSIRVLDVGEDGIRIEAGVGVRVPRIPSPRLVVLPEGATGLRPGQEGRLRLHLKNVGGRLPEGILHVFATDPRVRMGTIDLPVPGIPALGSLDLDASFPVRIDGIDAASLEAIPLEATLDAGESAFPLVAAIPLESCVAAREGFEAESPTVEQKLTHPLSPSVFARTREIATEGEWSYRAGGGDGYPSYVDASLVLGPYEVQRSAEIRFQHWVSTQAYGEYAHDGVFLEASDNRGRTWSLLTPLEGYPTRFTETSGNAYPGGPAWAGQIEGWNPVTVPVVGFEGDVFFRFHFVSDYTVSIPGQRGWFLDAFQVLTWDPAHAALFDPPIREPGGIRIRVRLLALAPAAAPGWIRLVRETGLEVVTLGSWPGTPSFEQTLLVSDVRPGRGERFRLEWDGHRSQDLVLDSADEALLAGTPGFLRKSNGGWIVYRVPASSPVPVRLVLADVRGALVAVLADGEHSPGEHAVSLPGTSAGRAIPAGVYFLRLAAGGRVESRRLVLLP